MEDIMQSLLDRIQDDFPLSSRPFLQLAAEFGNTEDEIIKRIQVLKDEGYIRRLGGVFDSKSLGYTSALCGAEIEECFIEEATQVINSYVGITHNYLRNHRYNMWFTVTAGSESQLETILEEIKHKGIIKDLLVLKSIKTFKIRVRFGLKEGE